MTEIDSSHQPVDTEAVTAEPGDTIYQQILAGRATLEKVTNPDIRAQLELTQNAMEVVAIGYHDLHALSHEEQVDAIETIAGILFDQDEKALERRNQIDRARSEGRESEAKELMTEQGKYYDDTKRELAFILGVELQDTEQENQEYRAALMQKVETLLGATDEEIMVGLGFMVPDEKTREFKFAYPENLFPPYIDTQWSRYTDLVRQHVKAASMFDRRISDDSGEVVQLDALRRYAHNNLASEVQTFLQLDNWDIERCRKFITKMVEQRFPTVETRESVLTSEAVLKHLRAIRLLDTVVHPVHSAEA